MALPLLKPSNPLLILPNIHKAQTIAIDLETNDPDLKTKAPGWVHGNGHICGICVATKDQEWYLPIGHEKGENIDKDTAIAWLQDLLNWDQNYVVFHNAHYDVGWLQHYGVDIKRPIVDTMLVAPLINENRFTYSLDSLAKEYLAGRGKSEDELEEAIKSEFEFDTIEDVDKYKLFNRVTKRIVHQEADKFKKRTDRGNFEIISEYVAPKKIHHGIPKTQMKKYLWKLYPEQVAVYGKQDVRLTFDLWRKFKPMVKLQGLKRVFDLEHKLIPAHIAMRKKGIRIDLKRAEELRAKYTTIIDENQEILDKLVGYHLIATNEGGSVVKACQKLDIPWGFTEKGEPSFAAENIPEGYDFFYGPLKKLQKYTKARDVFLTSYLSYAIGDRVHPQFNQLKSDDGGTVTGRYSCTSPNVQNIPARDPEIGPEIRSIFIPEDGEEWMTLDYSSQEPRMLVHLAIMMGKLFGLDRCPSAKIAMEKRFCGRDSDFHMEVARAVIDSQYAPIIEGYNDGEVEEYYHEHLARMPWVHHPVSDFQTEFKGEETLQKELIKFLHKKFRKPAKAIGLGVMYGRGVPSIVEGLRLDGIHLTIKEAQDIKDAVIKAVPFLEMVNKYYENQAKSKGFVETLLGRRGRFDRFEVLDFSDWRDDTITNKKRRASTFDSLVEAMNYYNEEILTKEGIKPPQRADAYKALNKVIQGSSADQTKSAMLMFYEAGVIDKLRMTVHDEISFSIKPGEDDPLWYRNIMETCLELMSASKCDPVCGGNWNEAK